MLQKSGVLTALKILNEKELTSAVLENTGNSEHYFPSVQHSLSFSPFRSCSITNYQFQSAAEWLPWHVFILSC